MSCVEHLSVRLREHGFRMTPQRMTILHILNHGGGHLTPNQVYIRASQSMPGITEPTVYRTLEFLVENHLALAARVGQTCGKTVELDHNALRRVYREMEKMTGYRSIPSHSTFFGLCPACQKEKIK